MCLARPPQKINIGQLIYDCEADIPLVECFLSASKGKKKCALAEHCMLKHCLEDGLSAMYSKLKKYTLADAIVARPKIRRQLGMKLKAV
jgi:Rrf2 family nitric oxide-sensitive transcriptional repressor